MYTNIYKKSEDIFHKHKKSIILLSCIGFNVLVFLILILLGQPIFATNDDYRMRLIISGRYSGNPNNQAIFLNIVLSTALSLLYRINENIEWYGLFFELGMFSSVCFCNYVFLKRSKSLYDFIKRQFIYLVIFALIFQKQILMPQFTTVSAFFGMAAIACIIELIYKYQHLNNHTQDNPIHDPVDGRTVACPSKNKIWPYCFLFLFFSFLSYLTRRYVFLMSLPVIIILILVGIIINYKQRKYFLWLLAGLLFISAILRICIWLNVNSDLMKDYIDFNVARAEVTDYEGIPDYNDNWEFYTELGIDEPDYEALSGRTFDVSDSISTENFIKIKEYTDKINNMPFIGKVISSFNDIFSQFFQGEVLFTSLGILFIFFMMAVQISKDKNWLNCTVVCLFPLYVVCGSAFLILFGRIMPRIIESMALFCAGGFLSLYGQSCVDKNTHTPSFCKEGLIKIMYGFTIVVISGICLLGNQYQLQRKSTAIRSSIADKVEELDVLREYADDHPDNFYFYNSLDFIAASERVFGIDNTEILNMDSLGNWYARSPLYYERNKLFGFETALEGLLECDNVYYVELGEYHPCIDGLISEQGKRLEQIDSVETSGKALSIYKCTDSEE